MTFVKPKKGTKGLLRFRQSISVKGVKYKVTSISANACKGNKKLTKVIIGVNIKKIGKKSILWLYEIKERHHKDNKTYKKEYRKRCICKNWEKCENKSIEKNKQTIQVRERGTTDGRKKDTETCYR